MSSASWTSKKLLGSRPVRPDGGMISGSYLERVWEEGSCAVVMPPCWLDLHICPWEVGKLTNEVDVWF